jgi:hypothetical protein
MMNRERVIELAREADACHDNVQVTPFLERFAALVVQHEREQCAKVCEQMSGPIETYNTAYEHYMKCAEAIRARGEK